MTSVESLLEAAAKHVGQPYIWQGKGAVKWTEAGLVPLDTPGLDCSGLVTCSLLEAGGPDWRATENAQSLFEKLVKGQFASVFKPHLRYYGASKQSITHIAFGIPVAQGGCLVIEAAGGGHLTLKPEPSARVFFHYETRRDLAGVTPLPEF